MKKEVCLLGAGGHARSLLNLLELAGLAVTGIYDDSYEAGKKEMISGYELKGRPADLSAGVAVVLAVGDNRRRQEAFELFSKAVYRANLLHPRACLENRVTIGSANQIFANVYINAKAEIGDNNIINTSAIIEHEAKIGSHNHVSVGAIICGRASVGSGCFIGAGSVVIDKVRISDGVIIGAQSVVVEDIVAAGVYAGCPARKIK